MSGFPGTGFVDVLELIRVGLEPVPRAPRSGDLTIAELGETEVSLAFDLEQAAEVAAAAAAAAAASAAGGSGGGGNMYKRPRREQVGGCVMAKQQEGTKWHTR